MIVGLYSCLLSPPITKRGRMWLGQPTLCLRHVMGQGTPLQPGPHALSNFQFRHERSYSDPGEGIAHLPYRQLFECLCTKSVSLQPYTCPCAAHKLANPGFCGSASCCCSAALSHFSCVIPVQPTAVSSSDPVPEAVGQGQHVR